MFDVDPQEKAIQGIYGSARSDWLSGFGFLIAP